jgi:hypothetical protein
MFLYELPLAGYANAANVPQCQLLLQFPEDAYMPERDAACCEGVNVQLRHAAVYGPDNQRLAYVQRANERHCWAVQFHHRGIVQAALQLHDPCPRPVDQVDEPLPHALLCLLGAFVCLPGAQQQFDLGYPILGELQQLLLPFVYLRKQLLKCEAILLPSCGVRAPSDL